MAQRPSLEISESRQIVSVDHKELPRVSAMVSADVSGGDTPSHDELHGPNALRRVSEPIPWSAYAIAFVELCERFSYYGTQVLC